MEPDILFKMEQEKLERARKIFKKGDLVMFRYNPGRPYSEDVMGVVLGVPFSHYMDGADPLVRVKWFDEEDADDYSVNILRDPKTKKLLFPLF